MYFNIYEVIYEMLKVKQYLYFTYEQKLLAQQWVLIILRFGKIFVLKSILRKQNKNVQFSEEIKISSENDEVKQNLRNVRDKITLL